MASYWDGVAKPDTYPPGAAWPPPEPVNGVLPKPAGWPDNVGWNAGYPLLPAVQERDRALGQGPPQGNPASASAAPAPGATAAPPPAAPTSQTSPTGPTTPAGVTPGVPTTPTVLGNAMPIPADLANLKPFLAHVAAFGGNLQVQAIPTGVPNAKPQYQVIYTMADGESTMTITYGLNGGQEFETIGVKGNIKSASAQDQALKAAQTDLANASASNADAETKRRQLENAQRAHNAARGLGANTDAELAQINQANASSAAGIANAGAAQANVDLAYVRAVAEVLKEQGYAANQAYQMALNYAVEKAKVDSGNTNTVINTATTLLNNDVAQRGQDVSLANTRLGAAMSGFSDDARTAISQNEYMPVGSDKAADMLLGLMGMRRITAEKYGGLKDIAREREPGVMTQIGRNTPVALPGLDYNEINAHADALQDRSGTGPGKWPTIPNAPFGTTGRVTAPAGHSSTFRPVTWDSSAPRTPEQQQAQRAADAQTPIGQQQQTATDAAFASGARQISRVGKNGEAWISDPTAPAGRRLVPWTSIPEGSRIDSDNMPDPQDQTVFPSVVDPITPPEGVKPVSFTSDPAAGAGAVVAQRNADREMDRLRAEDEERRRRRLNQVTATGSVFDDWVDDRRDPWDVPYFG